MKIELIKQNDNLNVSLGDMVITKHNHFLIIRDKVSTTFRRQVNRFESAYTLDTPRMIKPYRLLDLETGELYGTQYATLDAINEYFKTETIRIIKAHNLKIVETSVSGDEGWLPRKE